MSAPLRPLYVAISRDLQLLFDSGILEDKLRVDRFKSRVNRLNFRANAFDALCEKLKKADKLILFSSDKAQTTPGSESGQTQFVCCRKHTTLQAVNLVDVGVIERNHVERDEWLH